jgi:hypothetical protein
MDKLKSLESSIMQQFLSYAERNCPEVLELSLRKKLFLLELDLAHNFPDAFPMMWVMTVWGAIKSLIKNFDMHQLGPGDVNSMCGDIKREISKITEKYGDKLFAKYPAFFGMEKLPDDAQNNILKETAGIRYIELQKQVAEEAAFEDELQTALYSNQVKFLGKKNADKIQRAYGRHEGHESVVPSKQDIILNEKDYEVRN